MTRDGEEVVDWLKSRLSFFISYKCFSKMLGRPLISQWMWASSSRLFQDVDGFVDDFFADVSLLLHPIDEVVVFIGFEASEGSPAPHLIIENAEAGALRAQRFPDFWRSLLLVAAHGTGSTCCAGGPHALWRRSQIMAAKLSYRWTVVFFRR